MQRPKTIAIAGFSPSAGAGILSDIKTMESLEVFAFGVQTAMTWQNEEQFDRLSWFSAEDILHQLALIVQNHQIEAVKIGVIESAEVLLQVLHFLHDLPCKPQVVWDPVLKSSTGFSFASFSDALHDILPKVSLITPNIPEATSLFGEQLQIWSAQCPILLKGGHADKKGVDVLFEKESQKEINPSIQGELSPKHGSGCVLSSAITAYLAKGFPLNESCALGKQYVEKYLKSSPTLLGTHD